VLHSRVGSWPNPQPLDKTGHPHVSFSSFQKCLTSTKSATRWAARPQPAFGGLAQPPTLGSSENQGPSLDLKTAPSPTASRAQCYKTFMPSHLFMFVLTSTVCPLQAFPVTIKCSTIGLALGLTPNIRLGWKRLSWTNSLGYYENFVSYGQKSFITLAPGLNVIKLFYAPNLLMFVLS
jgi:hypothetical protein